MRILKPGDPCPCCGQPVPEDTAVETIYLLSWIRHGMELREALRAPEKAEPEWKRHLRRRFEQAEGEEG